MEWTEINGYFCMDSQLLDTMGSRNSTGACPV